MNFTSLELMLGGGFLTFLGGLSVKIYFQSRYVSKEDCTICVGQDLKHEVRVLRAFIRVLLEAQGITTQQQLEIERAVASARDIDG